MTDGIIQEVYKKLASPLIVEIDDVDIHVIPQEMVDDAFKELIEKIDKILNTSKYFNDFDMLRARLIGDNKE